MKTLRDVTVGETVTVKRLDGFYQRMQRVYP